MRQRVNLESNPRIREVKKLEDRRLWLFGPCMNLISIITPTEGVVFDQSFTISDAEPVKEGIYQRISFQNDGAT